MVALNRYDDDLRIHHRKTFLSNNGSTLVNVDGSVTPVAFEYLVPANQILHVQQIGILFSTNGQINDVADFLSINGGLSLGIPFEYQINSINTVAVNIKTNFDLFAQLTTTFDVKIIGNYSLVNGTINLVKPLTFVGANGDKLSATIRDDISSLSHSSISITGIQETI